MLLNKLHNHMIRGYVFHLIHTENAKFNYEIQFMKSVGCDITQILCGIGHRDLPVFKFEQLLKKMQDFFYCCTVHSDIHTVHPPTDAHLLQLLLKFTLNQLAPTCFGIRPSSRSLQLSLAKFILILKHSVRLCR